MTQSELPEEQNENIAIKPENLGEEEGNSDSAATVIEETAANSNSEAAQPAAEEEAPSETLLLSDNGEIVWNNVAIARLLPNQPLLSPKFELIGPELNQGETAKIVTQRLDGWLVETIRTDLAPLFRLRRAIEYTAPIVPIIEIVSKSNDEKTSEEKTGDIANGENTIADPETAPENSDTTDEIATSPANDEALGAQDDVAEQTDKAEEIVSEKAAKKPAKPVRAPMKEFSAQAKEIAQLVFDNCGILDRSLYDAKIAALSQDNRRELRNAGIKFGRNAIYLPLLLKPKPARLNVILSKLSQGELVQDKVLFPPLGVTSFEAKDDFADKDYLLCGFQKLGARAIRLDIVDRVLDTLFDAVKEAKGGFEMPLAVVSLLGVSNEAAQNTLIALGWSFEEAEDGVKKWRFKRPSSNFKRPENARGARTDGQRNAGHKNDSAKGNENRGKDQRGPRPPAQSFKKKHKDKSDKMRAPRDYSARPSRNIEDSPFAILASLKADMQSKKD